MKNLLDCPTYQSESSSGMKSCVKCIRRHELDAQMDNRLYKGKMKMKKLDTFWGCPWDLLFLCGRGTSLVCRPLARFLPYFLS